MLPQLVGLTCAVCSQRVGSEFDARFCEGCGNPIHNGCGPPPQPVSSDELLSAHEQPKCARCKGDPNTPVACRVRGAWIGHRAWKEVEEQAHLLVAAARYREQRLGARVGLVISLFVLCLAVALVAVKGVGRDPEGAMACVGLPVAGVVMYLVIAWVTRWGERAAEAKLDAALEEKERARIEAGEPPG